MDVDKEDLAHLKCKIFILSYYVLELNNIMLGFGDPIIGGTSQ